LGSQTRCLPASLSLWQATTAASAPQPPCCGSASESCFLKYPITKDAKNIFQKPAAPVMFSAFWYISKFRLKFFSLLSWFDDFFSYLCRQLHTHFFCNTCKVSLFFLILLTDLYTSTFAL